jgi:hypothetical protein
MHDLLIFAAGVAFALVAVFTLGWLIDWDLRRTDKRTRRRMGYLDITHQTTTTRPGNANSLTKFDWHDPMEYLTGEGRDASAEATDMPLDSQGGGCKPRPRHLRSL